MRLDYSWREVTLVVSLALQIERQQLPLSFETSGEQKSCSVLELLSEGAYEGAHTYMVC